MLWQVKKGGVPGTGGQKQAVVPKGMHRVIVLPEALSTFIIVVPGVVSLPARMALYPEMVVGFPREFTLPKTTFQQSLGQGNTGGDSVGFHLKLGDFGKGLYILFCRADGKIDELAGVFWYQVPGFFILSGSFSHLLTVLARVGGFLLGNAAGEQ